MEIRSTAIDAHAMPERLRGIALQLGVLMGATMGDKDRDEIVEIRTTFFADSAEDRAKRPNRTFGPSITVDAGLLQRTGITSKTNRIKPVLVSWLRLDVDDPETAMVTLDPTNFPGEGEFIGPTARAMEHMANRLSTKLELILGHLD